MAFKVRPVSVKRFFAGQRKVVSIGVITVAILGLGLTSWGAVGMVRHSLNANSIMGQKQGTAAKAQQNAKDVAGAQIHQEDQPAPTPPSSSTPVATPQKQPIKYSTSPDPSSTAYSTTPPAPNPASFNIKITHAGQLAPGDLVYYNADKGDKLYYGGDLVLSPSTVTISKSSLKWAPITVSSPNGKIISMPVNPPDDKSPYFMIAFHGTTAPALSSTYNMVVDTFGAFPAVGVYELHIATGSGDGYGYYGFITVNLVE